MVFQKFTIQCALISHCFHKPPNLDLNYHEQLLNGDKIKMRQLLCNYTTEEKGNSENFTDLI